MTDFVLLDLDGTLVDSRPGIAGSLNHTLTAFGHPAVPAAELTWAIGPPLEETAARLLAPHGDDRVAAFIHDYRAHYGERGLFDCTLYPGIPAALDAFAAESWSLCLATAKRTDFARRILENLGLADRFAGIYGAGLGGELDHKPAMIARIVAAHGISRAVMVGDRVHDVAGARANGFPAIGVLWGYGGRAELEAAGASALAEAPASLPGLARSLLAKRNNTKTQRNGQA